MGEFRLTLGCGVKATVNDVQYIYTFLSLTGTCIIYAYDDCGSLTIGRANMLLL